MSASAEWEEAIRRLQRYSEENRAWFQRMPRPTDLEAFDRWRDERRSIELPPPVDWRALMIAVARERGEQEA